MNSAKDMRTLLRIRATKISRNSLFSGSDMCDIIAKIPKTEEEITGFEDPYQFSVLKSNAEFH
jgi:hypothetical protein